ncbi:RAxF-45 family protein [Paenactinomyces guangxiensis]|nr:RAxF-45 family protein [Paenactinomyces guangxiensis]
MRTGLNGCMVWLAVEITAITHVLAFNGIRVPFFSQTASIHVRA